MSEVRKGFVDYEDQMCKIILQFGNSQSESTDFIVNGINYTVCRKVRELMGAMSDEAVGIFDGLVRNNIGNCNGFQKGLVELCPTLNGLLNADTCTEIMFCRIVTWISEKMMGDDELIVVLNSGPRSFDKDALNDFKDWIGLHSVFYIE